MVGLGVGEMKHTHQPAEDMRLCLDEVERPLVVVVVVGPIGLGVVAASALVLVVVVIASVGLGVVPGAALVLARLIVVSAVGLVVVAAATEEHGAGVVKGSVDGHCEGGVLVVIWMGGQVVVWCESCLVVTGVVVCRSAFECVDCL